jgi:hypothetical protein
VRDPLLPGRRLAGNTPVLILRTDGLPNRVPTPMRGGTQEDTVLAAAGWAKDAGVRVYPIAIGAPEDTNPALLRACPTDPSMYRYTPDAEDLGAIYTEIAHAVGCPAERFWGGPLCRLNRYSSQSSRCRPVGGGCPWVPGQISTAQHPCDALS